MAEAIAAGKARQLDKAELSAVRVLEELRRLAFVDGRSYWDESGNVKAMHELTPEQGSALAGFEVLIKNAKAGDRQTDTIHKFRLWDKPRSLEMLAKHFGLLRDTLDVTGDVTFSWQDGTS